MTYRTFDGTSQVEAITDGRFSSDGTQYVADAEKINIGTSKDLIIQHDGSNSYITHSGAGDFYIKTSGTNENVEIQAADDVNITVQENEDAIKCIGNGSVEIYYNNNKKLETLFNGIRATGGILFDSDTAQANRLSDYEEGTWTPIIADANSGGNTDGAQHAVGLYTKIGRQVTITCYINDLDTTSLTAGNDLYIRGLPYTSDSTTYNNSYGACIISGAEFGPSSSTFITPYIGSNDSWVRIYHSKASTNAGFLDVEDFTDDDNRIAFTITYFT